MQVGNDIVHKPDDTNDDDNEPQTPNYRNLVTGKPIAKI